VETIRPAVIGHEVAPDFRAQIGQFRFGSSEIVARQPVDAAPYSPTAA
jgi:hypothetical protein